MSEKSEIGTDGSLAKVIELSQPGKVGEPGDVIHRVVDQCLLNMVFQPIVDMRQGRIFAYEALCRSRVPEFDNPPAMIEAATAAGRVGELGRLQRSLASKNCPDWPIFVNISPNEFDQPWLVRPDDAIFRHRKPVYIEITESVPLVFFEQCHSVLAELRQKGAHLAIDDLGAGYSNLKYIADLAPDIVKLDRDLVAGCRMEGTQFELLRSIAGLCREVKASVVAEGIETAEELEAVSAAGIEFAQGFFLGRPKVHPSELNWPASELVTSESFRVRPIELERAVSEEAPEEAERRLHELETARALLEKSVRKARGEVVRLRKALNRAESRNERAQAKLANVEDSLAESEKNRRRLARLFEQATLRDHQTQEIEPVEAPPAPEPAPTSRLRRLVGHGLVWAAGLGAGLALYAFDPRVEREPKSDPAAASAVVATAVPEPTSVGSIPASPVEERAESEIAPATSEPLVAPEPPSTLDLETEEVRAEVLRWARAWSEQDVDEYLDRYSASFVSADGLSGEAWRTHRSERVLKPLTLDVELEAIEVQIESYGYATARFVQLYTSDSFSDQVSKELHLLREDYAWRIVSETVVE